MHISLDFPFSPIGYNIVNMRRIRYIEPPFLYAAQDSCSAVLRTTASSSFCRHTGHASWIWIWHRRTSGSTSLLCAPSGPVRKLLFLVVASSPWVRPLCLVCFLRWREGPKIRGPGAVTNPVNIRQGRGRKFSMQKHMSKLTTARRVLFLEMFVPSPRRRL